MFNKIYEMCIKKEKSQLLNQLKEHYKFSTHKEFADFLGVTPQSLNNWYARDTFDYEILYTKCLDVNSEWLFTGKGSMLKEVEMGITHQKPTLFEEYQKGAIPYYSDLPVSAGEYNLLSEDKREVPTGYMMIPNVDAQYLFPVVGYSMLPQIKPGDIIGVKSLNNWDRVDPDRIYLIITLEERMLKRLRIDNEVEDILWCISINYNEFKIKKCDIHRIYQVVFHGELM